MPNLNHTRTSVKSTEEMEKELLSMGEKYPYADLYDAPLPVWIVWLMDHGMELVFIALVLAVALMILW